MAEDFDEFLEDVYKAMEDNGYQHDDEKAVAFFMRELYGFNDDEEAEEALY